MSAAPPFKLTIIYESFEAGKRAKLFGDRFMAETAKDRPCELNLWNFGVLGIPEVRNAAASTAAIADVVILSMSGTVPLPAQAVEWIEMWTWLIDGRRPAVVALFADHHRQSAAIRAYLRRSAVGKKLEFFPVLTREAKEETRADGHRGSRTLWSRLEPRPARNDGDRPVIEPPPYE